MVDNDDYYGSKKKISDIPSYHNANQVVDDEYYESKKKISDIPAKNTKIRDFENEQEENLEDFEGRDDINDRKKSTREEKPVKSKNEQEKNRRRITSFKIPDLSDESVHASKLRDEVKEAAKYYLHFLSKKLEGDQSKNVLELFEILKVHF